MLKLTHLLIRPIKVKDEVYLYSFTGERLRRLAPDFVGTASISGRRGKSDIFVTMTSFTTPGVVARYDFSEIEEDKRWCTYRTTLVNGLDPEDFVSEQVSAVTSEFFNICGLLTLWRRSGTRVKMGPRSQCSSCDINRHNLMVPHLLFNTVGFLSFFLTVTVSVEAPTHFDKAMAVSAYLSTLFSARLSLLSFKNMELSSPCPIFAEEVRQYCLLHGTFDTEWL